MIKIGLVVNPVAGMGGLVGLKGTDGEMSRRAAELGAEPVTPVKIPEVLALVNGFRGSAAFRWEAGRKSMPC